MSNDLKMFIVQEGTKLVSELIRASLLKPRAYSPPPEEVTTTPPTSAKKEPLPDTKQPPVITRQGIDAERLAYQENLAYGEVWLLEGHLKNNCIGCGGDVECCWKHSDNLLRVAEETLSMTTDPFWQGLKALAIQIRDKTHPDDVRAGTYVSDYPALVVRSSEFRLPLQKKAMARQKPALTLDEAKKLAAEAATAEVERRYKEAEHAAD